MRLQEILFKQDKRKTTRGQELKPKALKESLQCVKYQLYAMTREKLGIK